MTRSQIISDLMDCLGEIKPENGFSTRPAEIKRGIHLAEEMNDLPGLTLFNERVETTDAASQSAERLLVLHLWGAARAPHSDYSGLDQLAADCMKALGDPDLNPHWARTSATRLEVYEGGAGDPLGLFDLEIEVTYESPLHQL
ncbi:MAG: hypothetical protein PVG03_01760 [Desulfarculaceae bacterium]|jgi:hypothetical protein